MIAAEWPDKFGPAGDHFVPLNEHRPDRNNPEGVGRCKLEFYSYVCTRPTGHDGRHAAGTGTELCAVWS